MTTMRSECCDAGVCVDRGARRFMVMAWLLPAVLLAAAVAARQLQGIGAALGASAPPAVEITRIPGLGPVPSHLGGLRAEVVAREPRARDETGRTQRWTVQIESRRRRRVAHAKVAGAAFMPAATDAPDSQPVVSRYIGGGRYEVTGFTLSRAGWWNVGLVIQHRGRTDSLAFNLMVP